MSLAETIMNLNPLYKGFFGIALGFILWYGLKCLIRSANKEADKINNIKKTRKQREFEQIKILTGEY